MFLSFNLLKIVFWRWLSLFSLLILGCLIWQFHPFWFELLNSKAKQILWNYSFIYFFGGLIWEYIWAYFLRENYTKNDSQCFNCLEIIFLLLKKQNIKQINKQGFLFILVHLFYFPLMLSFLIDKIYFFEKLFLDLNLNFNIFNFLFKINWLENLKDFGFLENLIYTFDVIPFAFAYFVNFGDFKTRSVNNSFLAWFFCLACYPPFNDAFSKIFYYTHTEMLNSVGGFLALICIFIYSWASMALMLRAGHLQYRGLCNTGPYAFVRHPAYITKNLAWIIGLINWTIFEIQNTNNLPNSYLLIFWNIIACIFWCWIYHMRAVTEEQHLKHYPEYLEYCKKVKYRYIPFLI